MKATEWVTKLHRIDRNLLPPTIIKKGNIQSCYYMVKSPHKKIYQVGLYTNDGWNTLQYVTVCDPSKKRVKVINVGGKQIKYETVTIQFYPD